jgi:hypothetical protein
LSSLASAVPVTHVDNSSNTRHAGDVPTTKHLALIRGRRGSDTEGSMTMTFGQVRTRPATKKSESHDRVLAYLVLATIICWTPNHVYFTMVRVRKYWNPTYFAVQYCVFYTNSWLNPIICYCTLSNFRKAINDLLHCRH